MVSCCEDSDLHPSDCFDDPNEGYAHNVSMCYNCGAIVIDRVWLNSGRTIVKSNGEVLQS